jgi:uncharacterized membrane protein
MRSPAEQAPAREPADPRLSTGLSRLLRVGLAVAIALMLAGAILAAVRGHGSVQRTSSITGLPHLLANGDPTGFLGLGLLVLLATPFARVVALCVVFVRRRQWLFAGISLVVVAVLFFSAFLSLGLV